MTRSARVWIISGVMLSVFLLMGGLIPRWIGLQAPAFWILRGLIWLLGLLAVTLVFLYLRRKAKASPAEEPRRRDEIDVTLAAARKRLATARGKGARINSMPVILVAGPVASAKTTVVTRSGLEPELLAGEVYRGDSVMPTGAVNVWYAQDNLVVEAGSPVVGDAGRWRRLVRHIQPKRLAAVFRRGRQAPRVAVVCFGCDELLKPGAAEAVPAAAQKLRARLAEASQQIGIRLPVYVLFTKADRLPYFEEYVRSMTREEARDVLGVTLTVPPAGDVGAYGERESRRLADGFSVLFRGLALRRLDALPRETQEDVKAGVYEFPREFRKITDLATRFMLDLCRPSQLGVSPFLRGFYFTGVRAVYEHDAGAEPQRPAGPAQPAVDATGVFDPRMLQQAKQPVQPVAGSRKVPEWTFLERVFSDVLLRDGVARGVTGGGTKVNLLRRGLIAAGALACLIFSFGFTVSYFRNASMLRDAKSAAGIAGPVGTVPDIDSLQRLDSLRAQTALLDSHRRDRDGHPFWSGWMLYAGGRVQPRLRELYFQKFATLLWNGTRLRLDGYLRSLPATPTETSAYDSTYEALKAYIATTSLPDSAHRSFLTPTLMRFWPGRNQDTTRTRLTQAQFDFFADELPFGNPYDIEADSQIIIQTRGYLGRFAGGEQFYRALLAAAGDSATDVVWSNPIVRNEYVVPAAFTRIGWDRAQATLNDVPRLFDREPWVIGESAVRPQERDQLALELRATYTEDFIRHWMSFLEGGDVTGFGTTRQAAVTLDELSKNTSPLVRMLEIVSNNTFVDTTLVGVAFKPVYDVVPPNQQTVTNAGPYLNALAKLKSALDQLVAGSGATPDPAMSSAVRMAATDVRSEISNLDRGFSTEGDARMVGQAVTRLLQGPPNTTEGLLTALPAQALNGTRTQFCAPFTRLGRGFPFNSNSMNDASLDDLIAAVNPTDGALWAFYESSYRGLLARRGNTFDAQPGANPAPYPAFVDFYRRAAAISNALFATGGSGAEVLYTLRFDSLSFAMPSVTVTLGGQTVQFTRSSPAGPPGTTFEWDGTATDARIIVQGEAGPDIPVANEPPGPWSTFRAFYRAEMESLGGGRYRVSWPLPNSAARLQGELSYASGASVPIFQRGYLARLANCPARIAR